MSVDAEFTATRQIPAPARSYDRVLKLVHWATPLLIAAAYAVVWASQYAASKEQQAIMVQLHRSLGVTVFALTLLRKRWRWHARIPAIQKIAARTTEYLLYLLLLLQPICGIVHTNAQGRRVDFYFLGELPTLVGRDKVLAGEAMGAHEFAAYPLSALIGLHAAAALFHHYIRRDSVLKGMPPVHRREPRSK